MAQIQKEKAEFTGEEQYKELLPGEIKGITVRFCSVNSSERTLPELQNRERVLLFYAGSGQVDTGSSIFGITEAALLVPEPGKDCTVSSTAELSFLELISDFSEEDIEEMEGYADSHPFFLSYSQCRTYREKIKSPKTINRTLLPEHIFPRLSIGSVETEGPDQVAAHEHPMLEQLFFGLSENDCTVTADETHTEFLENDLLHIPLGSTHGVRVEQGRKLHYIWIDMFEKCEDMYWLSEQHVED